MAEYEIQHAYLFESGGSLVGYAIMQVVAGEAECLRIAVRPKYRRQGLGKQALRALLQELAREEILVCFLEVRADNRAAHRLYQSCRFEQIAIRNGYYDDGCDAVIMKWEAAIE